MPEKWLSLSGTMAHFALEYSEDEHCRKRLLDLVKKHLKLLLKFDDPEITVVRNEKIKIKAGIELLRIEWDNLLFHIPLTDKY